eukprot:scaffold81961_cov30-Tisochrysis_lutea.AAC.4
MKDSSSTPSIVVGSSSTVSNSQHWRATPSSAVSQSRDAKRRDVEDRATSKAGTAAAAATAMLSDKAAAVAAAAAAAGVASRNSISSIRMTLGLWLARAARVSQQRTWTAAGASAQASAVRAAGSKPAEHKAR